MEAIEIPTLPNKTDLKLTPQSLFPKIKTLTKTYVALWTGVLAYSTFYLKPLMVLYLLLVACFIWAMIDNYISIRIKDGEETLWKEEKIKLSKELSTKDFDYLQKYIESPEVDCGSASIARQVRNTKYSGWSFQ